MYKNEALERVGGTPEASKSGLWHQSGRRWSPEGDLEVILAPKMVHFGSHLGAMLELCCNFFVIFLGCEIKTYFEYVSDAILIDFGTS